MSTKDTLIAAKALVENPLKWFGGDVPMTSSGQYCIFTALVEVGDDASAYRHLASYTKGSSLIGFNDTHSHVEVMKAFDEAIATA